MAQRDDYVLGTHDEELQRLGLQHRVWRPVVLEGWQRAGITVGSRVLDVGAGPGYATIDLAEIVGPSGKVTALERSARFVRAIEETARQRALKNVATHELDLMTSELPAGSYDFSWCRWVLCFLSDPELLIQKLSRVLGKGSRAIFHEYVHYETWRYLPPLETQEEFRRQVVRSWRESGGDPDAAKALPELLDRNGFVIRDLRPLIFAVRPKEFFWQWPATFIDVYLPRLREMGQVDDAFVARFREDMVAAEKNPNALMITPLVLEIIAEKVS